MSATQSLMRHRLFRKAATSTYIHAGCMHTSVKECTLFCNTHVYIQASLVRNHNIHHTAGLLLHQTCVWGLWHLDCQRNQSKIAIYVNFETN